MMCSTSKITLSSCQCHDRIYHKVAGAATPEICEHRRSANQKTDSKNGTIIEESGV